MASSRPSNFSLSCGEPRRSSGCTAAGSGRPGRAAPDCRKGQVLGGQPEVHRVPGQANGVFGVRGVEGDERRVVLAEHLQRPQRIREGAVVVRVAEVEVVHAQRLLEPGRVRDLGEGDERGVVVHHQVAAHHAGGVAQACRMAFAGRGQQQRGRVDRAGGDHNQVGGVGLGLSVAVGDHPRDAPDLFSTDLRLRDPRFVAERRVPVGRRRGRLAGVGAALAVDNAVASAPARVYQGSKSA